MTRKVQFSGSAAADSSFQDPFEPLPLAPLTHFKDALHKCNLLIEYQHYSSGFVAICYDYNIRNNLDSLHFVDIRVFSNLKCFKLYQLWNGTYIRVKPIGIGKFVRTLVKKSSIILYHVKVAAAVNEHSSPGKSAQQKLTDLLITREVTKFNLNIFSSLEQLQDALSSSEKLSSVPLLKIFLERHEIKFNFCTSYISDCDCNKRINTTRTCSFPLVIGAIISLWWSSRNSKNAEISVKLAYCSAFFAFTLYFVLIFVRPVNSKFRLLFVNISKFSTFIDTMTFNLPSSIG